MSMPEEGHVVDSIYLDFSKAFDGVDHKILLLKTKILNITGKVPQWIDVLQVLQWKLSKKKETGSKD